MCVPDPLRVEARPSFPDQFVPREREWQADTAGIPEALLGPEFPGRKRAGAGERGATQQKMPSFQKRKEIRRASS